MKDFPTIMPELIDNDDRREFKLSTFEDCLDPRAERMSNLFTRIHEMTTPEAMALIGETYPRIHNMIRMLWGTPLLHERLSKMLFLDTHGREGFDKPVGLALAKIHDVHMEENGYPPMLHIENMERDIW